jgi:hypothetical protein
MRLRRPLTLALLTALALSPGLVTAAETTSGTPHIAAWRPPSQAFLPDTTVLVRVEGSSVTAAKVVWTYFGTYFPDRPPSDSLGRVQFLNSIVDQKVLGLLARERNAPLSFEDRGTLRDDEQRVLSNILYTREVTDSVRADTSDARRCYNAAGVERHLRQIRFRDPASAEKARAGLMTHRTTWAQAYVAGEEGLRSALQGDIGWVSQTSAGIRFPQAVHALKPGEYSQPWGSIGGWYLVQCLEIRPVPQPTFQVAQSRYLIVARNLMAAERGERLAATLRERGHYTYDTTNVRWVSDRFTESNPPATSPGVHLGTTMPAFSAEDVKRVLARGPAGEYDLAALLRSYSALSPITRPKLDSPEAVRWQVDADVLRPVRAEYARSKGYDHDPDAMEQLDRRREELMVEEMYRDSVESRIKITPEMRRRYYDQNLTQFITFASVRFAMFECPARGEADSIAARLRAGTEAQMIVRADSLAGRRRGGIYPMTSEERGTPFYNLLFEELKPGQVSVQGPGDHGQWTTLQLLSFDGGHQLSFEQSVTMVDQSLQNLEADRLLRELINRHRGRFHIEIHPELVMRVRWKDPTLEE